ncbi:uncharacterized protein LOC135218501 [Macrobrachium nipponense]|uniref:uncharacterized protein LOC135218501 n=1 Tax=Macrobrachium nipponense TaxID=159736 RepID=UPI0030C7C4E9
MKGDKAKTTGDSETKKGERKEGIGKKGYDPKNPSMKSGETSRTERDVGNKGKSGERADIGKPKKKGGKYTGNDEGSPETVAEADENVDGSTDDASLREDRAGKRKYACNLRKESKLSGSSETDVEGNPVECTGEADEVVNADESRNSIPEASDATETTDKRDQDTNNDIHGAGSDSDDYAGSEMSSSESTTATPGSYEPPPFPQVTPEFDSSTGKSDVNEDATDTESLESHLSAGRKVEVDITDEQNEEVIHDSNMDNLEDSKNLLNIMKTQRRPREIYKKPMIRKMKKRNQSF